MEREIYNYSGKNPVVLAFGDHYEIGNILRELQLNPAIQRFNGFLFNQKREAYVTNIKTPYGLLDAYIRIVQGNEFGKIALVISPSATNENGAASLQKVIDSIKTAEQNPRTLDTSVEMASNT